MLTQSLSLSLSGAGEAQAGPWPSNLCAHACPLSIRDCPLWTLHLQQWEEATTALNLGEIILFQGDITHVGSSYGSCEG